MSPQARKVRSAESGVRSQETKRTFHSALRTPHSALRKRPCAIRNGFTLLEVLVAMAVLAVAVVSLLGLFNRSLLLTIRAQRVNTALLLAQELLTRTQLEGAQAARRTSGDFTVSHPGLPPEFRWQRRVHAAPIKGLWEIRVRVAWGAGEHDGCELTLFTPLDGQ